MTGDNDMKNESYNRLDTSLSLLTKRFVDLLSESGVVDLNQCSQTLHVQKRRLYDITNVLEGCGLLEKKSKNNVQWCHQNNDLFCSNPQDNHRSDGKKSSSELNEKENSLNAVIAELKNDISELISSNYAYVTCHDLNKVMSFKDQILITLQMPSDSKLTIPNIDQPHELHVKSTKDEILAYVFEDMPEDDASQLMNPSEPKSTMTNTNQLGKSTCSTSTADALATSKKTFSESTENLWLPSEMSGKLVSRFASASRDYWLFS